jgi:hypothetical protein
VWLIKKLRYDRANGKHIAEAREVNEKMGVVKLSLNQTSNLISVALGFGATGPVRASVADLQLCGETYLAPRALQQHTRAISIEIRLFSESGIDSSEHPPQSPPFPERFLLPSAFRPAAMIPEHNGKKLGS